MQLVAKYLMKHVEKTKANTKDASSTFTAGLVILFNLAELKAVYSLNLLGEFHGTQALETLTNAINLTGHQ